MKIRYFRNLKNKTNIVTKAAENRKNTEQKIKTAEFRQSAEKDHVWLFGCLAANFVPFLRGQPYQPNVNHCIFTILTQNSL